MSKTRLISEIDTKLVSCRLNIHCNASAYARVIFYLLDAICFPIQIIYTFFIFGKTIAIFLSFNAM